MNVLSLFAGIGGLDLGLERAGMRVVGQVEIDPYRQRVLARHWPEVPRHDDVRTAVEWWHRQPRPTVDLICGGFPCQDISNAGRRAGIDGERSGLWAWMVHVVRALRPRYVLMENVAAILVRGLDSVAADLAACGYDLRWDCIPAAAVGAPHRRDRWFGIAYVADADGRRRDGRPRVFRPRRRGQPTHSGWWATEPDVGRVAHGIPHRVDRLRSLGNAVVPEVAEHVAQLILAHDRALTVIP